jgi:hypothetical protein
VKALDVQRLQCVDESGATRARSRRYGWATPGQRVVDHVPDHYDGGNDTMRAAMGLHAPWVVDGVVNGDLFYWWVRHLLGPTLQPRDIMLWGNLSAHKVARVEALLEARGAQLLQ